MKVVFPYFSECSLLAKLIFVNARVRKENREIYFVVSLNFFSKRQNSNRVTRIQLIMS